MSTIVEINIDVLTQEVNEGKKKAELAIKYGLSELDMAKALKQAGLKIRKFKKPTFKLVSGNESVKDDTTDNTIQENLATEEKEEVDSLLEATAETTDSPEAESTETVTWTT